MEPLISVIIPIYNMGLYLERCLDSILNSSYQTLEIICVDDGSSDNTPEILRKYALRDSRILVITKENGGVSSARNAGLERMTGEYVSFIDADDYIHPQYFEILFNTLKVSGADIAIASHIKTTDYNTPLELPYYSLISESIQLFTYSQVGHNYQIYSYICSKLIPKKIIGSIRFSLGISYGEDTLFLLSLLEGKPSLRFGVTQFPLYFYCQRQSKELFQKGRYKEAVRFVSALFMGISNSESEQIYMEPALIHGLFYRYYYTFICPEKSISKELSRILRSRIIQLMFSQHFSLRFKVLRSLFILFPGLDRLYRFKRDPTAKQFEKKQKAAVTTRKIDVK